MGFVVNFLLFPVVKKIENQLRFDEVTAMSLVAPFCVEMAYNVNNAAH